LRWYAFASLSATCVKHGSPKRGWRPARPGPPKNQDMTGRPPRVRNPSCAMDHRSRHVAWGGSNPSDMASSVIESASDMRWSRTCLVKTRRLCSISRVVRCRWKILTEPVHAVSVSSRFIRCGVTWIRCCGTIYVTSFVPAPFEPAIELLIITRAPWSRCLYPIPVLFALHDCFSIPSAGIDPAPHAS
jgi:hypothetical protein